MNPLLSIIMPTYNGEQFVSAALESVRAQDHEGIELVVVDDGSSDRTLDIVGDFAEVLPIQLITPRRVGNWVAVSNLGLREARGDWACFLHQDDIWLPDRMARLRGEMSRSQGALMLHNAVFIGPKGEQLGAWTCPLAEGMVPPDQFVEHLLVQNFIAISSPVFRRKPAVESGGMDEALWFSADWDLWLRLGALGPVRFIAEILSAFRVHGASQTTARKLLPNEWEQQLTTVLFRHLQNWPGTGSVRSSVQRAAMASIAMNSALSAASRGDPVKAWAVVRRLLALEPSGWHRYLRDSRIVQRVKPRLKLRF